MKAYTNFCSASVQILFIFYLFNIHAVAATAKQLEHPKQLKVLTCEEPPTNFMHNGKVTGIMTDIVTELLKRTQTDGKIKLLPWARAYQTALEEENVVLFTAGKTEQRENLFHWVGPVFLKRWVVFAKRDSHFTIKNLEDMKSVGKIAVLRNDARTQLLKKNGFSNLLEVDTHEQAIKLLSLGRVDLWPSSDMEAPVIAQKANVSFRDLQSVYVLKVIHPHIIISKKTSPDVVETWQKSFKSMIQDGTLDEIAKKWSKRLDAPFQVQNNVIVLQDE